MEIIFGLVLLALLFWILNRWDRRDADKIEIRPSVWDKPKHPEARVDFTSGGPEKRSPFVPYDPVARVERPCDTEPMVAHDDAKDASGLSGGFGHDDYRKPKE